MTSAHYANWVFDCPMVDNYTHVPVLVEETMGFLKPEKRHFILDATCGAGGHSEEIAHRMQDRAILVCNDWDPSAVSVARERLLTLGKTVLFTSENFSSIERICNLTGIKIFDAVLLDLGVSSMQLDDPARGFSFSRNGPLDMRMNPDIPENAFYLVNNLPMPELARIFREYGEEKKAFQIATRIVEYRKKEKIRSTSTLTEIICRSIPGRKRKIHPATKVFQALRIAVNRELENLKSFLEKIPEHLDHDSVLAIISFHSLEDRIVKNFFRNWAREKACEILTRKPVTPTALEIKNNPRSRSARLRAIRWIGR